MIYGVREKGIKRYREYYLEIIKKKSNANGFLMIYFWWPNFADK